MPAPLHKQQSFANPTRLRVEDRKRNAEHIPMSGRNDILVKKITVREEGK
jgi:hypothetical protein